MRKIDDQSYDEIEEKVELISKYTENFSELIDIVSCKFNEVLQETKIGKDELTLNELKDQIQQEQAALTEILDEVHSDMNAYVDDRSESWHDSEKGETYSVWMESIEMLKNSIENIQLEPEIFISEHLDSCDITYDEESINSIEDMPVRTLNELDC